MERSEGKSPGATVAKRRGVSTAPEPSEYNDIEKAAGGCGRLFHRKERYETGYT